MHQQITGRILLITTQDRIGIKPAWLLNLLRIQYLHDEAFLSSGVQPLRVSAASLTTCNQTKTSTSYQPSLLTPSSCCLLSLNSSLTVVLGLHGTSIAYGSSSAKAAEPVVRAAGQQLAVEPATAPLSVVRAVHPDSLAAPGPEQVKAQQDLEEPGGLPESTPAALLHE